MPVVCGYCCGGGQSGEPFEAEPDVVEFRYGGPCWQGHVGAEAPSAVGELSEAGSQAVGLVFGFGCDMFSELGEDVAGAGGELPDCGCVPGCESCGDDGGPPFGFHFVVLSLFVDDSCRSVVDCPAGQY